MLHRFFCVNCGRLIRRNVSEETGGFCRDCAEQLDASVVG
jgi:NMD protein affecting ribosome stability and mRNA decay